MSRLTHRRLVLILTAVAGCRTLLAQQAKAQDTPRPHIIHIVADDLGWRDVGFHGSPEVKTPNIDKLAADGVRLESFYVTPMCTPTRAALIDQREMRDNTLIVFHSDNGGLTSAKMAGESPAPPVADNGPYRDGKGTVYEGGCRVVALANWPDRIKAGGTSNELLNGVDLYPTFVALAGGKTEKVKKPFDGVDVWATISEGKPSPRTEVVYNIEPSVAGLRQNEWKLVWDASLPAAVELFNLAEDPSEKTNLAGMYPNKVRALQKRVTELSAEQAPPLFSQATQELVGRLSPTLPTRVR